VEEKNQVKGRKKPSLLNYLFIGIFFLILFFVPSSKVLFGSRVWTELWIVIGFFAFFMWPGTFVQFIMFPKDQLSIPEKIPLTVVLSMGVFSVPLLVLYRYETSLGFVFLTEIIIISLLAVTAGYKSLKERKNNSPSAFSWNTLIVLAAIMALAGFSLFIGSFRGVVFDWDYFNYISHVNKLVAWDSARISHFAYIDAPPDPVHSYNIWALQWALISKYFGINPIELYSRSGFITIPIAALSFYTLGRRLFNENIGRTALILYLSYHVIYGGLLFLGRSSFYPADSQWLIVFPACVALFMIIVNGEKRSPGLITALALSVLALSTVHVLWGLCFYITASSFILFLILKKYKVWEKVINGWNQGKKLLLASAFSLAIFPVATVLITCLIMNSREDLYGFKPVFGDNPNLSIWIYAFIFIVAPAGLFFLGTRPFININEEKDESNSRPVIKISAMVMAICLLTAIPYALIRYGAIDATAWGQFGRNPYRAFIVGDLFFLNPFQRSLDNPNMTFYPLYILGYLCVPFLIYYYKAQKISKTPTDLSGFWDSKLNENGPLLVIAVLFVVPLICFHPIFATLFTKYFSLGYLRRFLRLGAMFSFFSLALFIHIAIDRILGSDKRSALKFIASLAIIILLALACIPFKSNLTYYNNMLKRTVHIAKNSPKDSLIYDSTPFEVIKNNGWFEDDDVILSDIWTSYRLTAYLPQYVAVQHKPGTGVKNQDERREMEYEFFAPITPLAEMIKILDQTGARGIIVNRHPGYNIYNLSCGHPEAVGKLKSDPEKFELLYDKDDWVIFRRK
jgi:hypothetical protein